MASHHCHYPHPPTNPASYSCHCCYATYTSCQHHHPPPPPPPPLPLPDPYPHHPPHQPHLYSAPSRIPNFPQYPEQFQEPYFREGRQHHPTVSSLLLRIAALESALSRRSSHPSPSQSLRSAAARTIQAHFRAFLLRRSITLRQLKDLASIKSNLGVLKSSVSGKTHFDYEVVYHKAMNLLMNLDAIKGGDPLIRNGKSSLSREINNFLDFLEGACVQRRALSVGVNVRQGDNNVSSRVSDSDRKIGNAKSGCLKRVNLEKLRGLVERIDRLTEEIDEEQDETIKSPNDDLMIRNVDVSTNRTGGLLKQHGGVQPKVKKTVSFVENGRVYNVLQRCRDPNLEECKNDGDDLVGDLVERIDRLTEEIHEKQNEAIKSPNNECMIRKVDVSTNRTGGLKQHCGVQPKVKKTVSFVENGRVYSVLQRRSEPNHEECKNDGDDLVGDDELDDDICRDIGVSSRTNDVEEEAEEDSLISSDDERDSRGYPATEEKNYEMTRHDADDFIFSAPVPVRMESRGNSNEKRRN